MRKGKTYILAAVLLVAVIALAGFAAACGGSSDSESSPSPQATSAADIAQQILGKAPTGLAAKIVTAGTVVVANDANYAPQSSIDKATGDLVGFDVDVAKKMAEILGLQVKFENPAWETIPAGLNQGKYDVSIGSMTVTPERQKALDFTEPYYYTSGQVFVKKGGTQITSVKDLDGKKVGVGAATTYYDYLKTNSTADVKTYTTDADAFPDLRNGNLDFVMTAGPTGQQAILAGSAVRLLRRSALLRGPRVRYQKGRGRLAHDAQLRHRADARGRLAHRDEREVVQRPRFDGQGVVTLRPRPRGAAA